MFLLALTRSYTHIGLSICCACADHCATSTHMSVARTNVISTCNHYCALRNEIMRLQTLTHTMPQGQWESYIVETSGSSALGGWQQGRRASSSSTLSGIDSVHNHNNHNNHTLGLRGLHHLRSYVWMSDDDTHKCCGCARQFDLLARRHHW
jgi:hypothetical protein